MDERRWTEVDHYLERTLLPADEALERALTTAAAAGLPAIAVSRAQGKLLHLHARMLRARAILEIGTLGGYSAIWLARALPPGGKLVTLEIDPKRAELARANLAHAKLDAVASVRVGPALETLPSLRSEAPFDFVFIDADKPNNARYFSAALELVRPGAAIVVDNVVRGGAIVDDTADPSVEGVRALFAAVAREPRVTATAIQTVGTKGYDGFLMAVVGEP